MKRFVWKRVLAMVLCVVLLIMCWPIQQAAATEPSLEEGGKPAPVSEEAVSYTIAVTCGDQAVVDAVVDVYRGNELQTGRSAKTDENGKATLSLPKPAEGETAITYTLSIQADSMRAYELPVEVSADTEDNLQPKSVSLSVAAANLTVKVVDAYGNPCANVQVTLRAKNGESKNQTTGAEGESLGVVVFENLNTAESYELSVEKPEEETTPYFYTDSNGIVPAAPANGENWNVELPVISCKAEETSREISITSDNVSHIEVAGTDGYLLYDLFAAGYPCLYRRVPDLYCRTGGGESAIQR